MAVAKATIPLKTRVVGEGVPLKNMLPKEGFPTRSQAAKKPGDESWVLMDTTKQLQLVKGGIHYTSASFDLAAMDCLHDVRICCFTRSLHCIARS